MKLAYPTQNVCAFCNKERNPERIYYLGHAFKGKPDPGTCSCSQFSLDYQAGTDDVIRKDMLRWNEEYQKSRYGW